VTSTAAGVTPAGAIANPVAAPGKPGAPSHHVAPQAGVSGPASAAPGPPAAGGLPVAAGLPPLAPVLAGAYAPQTRTSGVTLVGVALDGLPGIGAIGFRLPSNLFDPLSWAAASEPPALLGPAAGGMRGDRAPPEAVRAPLPTSPPGAVLVGAAAAGGAAAAIFLLVCLATSLGVAPPLRRWLRRQHGSRLLPAFVPPLERPG
jgi:hypothetical protein